MQSQHARFTARPRPQCLRFRTPARRPAASSPGARRFADAWSWCDVAPQAGDTLVRNTLRNGTKIRDIEKDAAARGIYTSFCGYFHVIPQEHKLTGNQFWYSDVPGRYAQWQQRGVKATVQSLATLPTAWLTAYNDYFAENGWEDAPAPGTAKERAFAPAAGRGAAAAAADDGGRRAPHWYSVRPPLVLAA
ncbi:hypothetical protein MNEG_10070 [Monoraphidium neglectum]|uniref:Uncharacterized protein n=1 Tax=Monoraphidium neglectum TaxID=145388 RepID=A0A0D2MAB0_9CHLO|nr:hypothetical protein MNEG_10070 [Monoraphidium neglectum]KIY97891.1 hypothetical protein MNEG_10070 [Monoraphidium neglectum]|eukprot:XP_013896911.1 hypothetical protein MNEG_10070 [Monoraphidium neglectum]